MKSITENLSRVGNFTSSPIVRLTGNGKRDMTPAELAARPKSGAGSKVKQIEDPGILDDVALGYIAEKNMERRLGRSIGTDIQARATSWGHLCEDRVFALLDTDYKICSTETIPHPEIDFWKGSPDFLKFDEGNTVCDAKCPMTLKSFCTLVDPLYDGLTGIDALNAIRNGYTDRAGAVHEKHKEGDTYYFQLVSNGILSGSRYAELIVYCPYKSELNDIRNIVRDMDDDSSHFDWVKYVSDQELPYLLDGGFYKNVNIIRFEIPLADKIILIERVESAGKFLINKK